MFQTQFQLSVTFPNFTRFPRKFYHKFIISFALIERGPKNNNGHYYEVLGQFEGKKNRKFPYVSNDGLPCAVVQCW
jgi:hypothetical protein